MKYSRNLILIIGLFFFNSAKSTTIDSFFYALEMRPVADRTELFVNLSFHLPKDSSVKIGLRRDYYGTGAIYQYLKNVTGDNVTEVAPSGVNGEFLIRCKTGSTASLSYTLSFDPKDLLTSSYAPNTGPGYFHAALCQFAFTMADHNTPAYYQFRVNAPAKWNIYSSIADTAKSFSAYGSFYDLFEKIIGGGTQPQQTFLVNGKTLRVFIMGTYDIGTAKIFSYVYEIFKGQHNWFKDYDFPFYIVTILPRADNVAGINIRNMFLCHIKKDVTKIQLLSLLSHEMLHTWVGKKATIGSNLPYAFYTHWFSEGYNEYLSKKMLYDFKLFNRSEFIYSINLLLRLVQANPYRSYTADQLTALADSGKYSTAPTKLQYYKGALMAIKYDKSIRNLLELLLNYARKENIISIPPDTFFELTGQISDSIQSDYQRYIINGEIPLPDPRAMGNDYTLKQISIPKFDLGYSTVLKDQYYEFTDIRENSNAYRSGLRNGMRYISSENTNMFSNAWNPLSPVKIVATDDKGITHTFSFSPQGSPEPVYQFVKK